MSSKNARPQQLDKILAWPDNAQLDIITIFSFQTQQEATAIMNEEEHPPKQAK